MLGNHRPANETPVQWRFVGWSIMARFWWYFDHLSHYQLIKKINKKNFVRVDPIRQNFMDPRMHSRSLALDFNTQIHIVLKVTCYEGCSNMNASSFITFFTYMLRQNGKRFYKGLYVIFNLAPDLKKNTVYLSSYSPLIGGHVSILINPMLRTYTSGRGERIILR